MKRFIDSFGWGFVLWFMGYILGFVFYFAVPKSLIGWCIMPIGIVLTWWILLKRISEKHIYYYAWLGLCWSLMAIVLDYLGIVTLLKTGLSYYVFDVLLYYFLTATMPLAAWFWKQRNSKTVKSVLHR